jgi:hypothetical protein
VIQAVIDLVSLWSGLFGDFRDGLFILVCMPDVENLQMMSEAVGALLAVIVASTASRFSSLLLYFSHHRRLWKSYHNEILHLLALSEGKRFVEGDFGGSLFQATADML